MLAVLVAVSSFVVVSNSILIYALVKTSRPFSKATQMFVCLSFVDMMNVVTNAIYSLLFAYLPHGSCILKFVMYVLSSSLFFLGITIFFSISILRYLALKKPFLQVNMRIVWSVNFTMFFLSTAYNLVSYLMSPSNFFEKKFKNDQVSVMFLTMTCILLILIINIASFRAIQTTNFACTNQRRNSTKVSTDGDVKNNSSSGHHKKRAVKTLIIITSFYLISNIPLALFTLLTYLDWVEISLITLWMFRGYLFQLVLLNCGVNAVVYMNRTKKVRKFLYCWITCTIGTSIFSEDHGV